MRKAVWASAIAAALTIGTVNAAQAATTFSYIPNVGGSFEDTAPIRTNAQGNAIAGVFNDTFSFTTTKSVLASFTFSSTGGISTASPTYLKFNTATINGTNIPVSIVSGTSTQTRTGNLLDFRLPAGVQTLFLSGDTGRSGSYSGSFSLIAVPEASTWAMMIAGFGMIAGTMRHRARSTRKTVFA